MGTHILLLPDASAEVCSTMTVSRRSACLSTGICPLQAGLLQFSSDYRVQPTFTLNVSSQSRMPPFDWSQGHVVTTTSPRFLQHSTGFQCATALCSRLWCWCGSVLTAQLPATSPNSAFLLPLLQVVSISGQPRRAYYKFPGPKP